MRRSLIRIYALAVCFAASTCLVVALGVGLYDLVRIAAPEFTAAPLPHHQSDERFLERFPDKAGLPPGELGQLRWAGLRDAVAEERRAAMRSGVFAGVIAAIGAVVFAVHRRIAGRAERPRGSAPHGEPPKRPWWRKRRSWIAAATLAIAPLVAYPVSVVPASYALGRWHRRPLGSTFNRFYGPLYRAADGTGTRDRLMSLIVRQMNAGAAAAEAADDGPPPPPLTRAEMREREAKELGELSGRAAADATINRTHWTPSSQRSSSPEPAEPAAAVDRATR